MVADMCRGQLDRLVSLHSIHWPEQLGFVLAARHRFCPAVDLHPVESLSHLQVKSVIWLKHHKSPRSQNFTESLFFNVLSHQSLSVCQQKMIKLLLPF